MGRTEEETIISYLTPGRDVEVAGKHGTKYNALVRAFGAMIECLDEMEKEYLGGVFIQKSSIFLKDHMVEMGIPDDVFHLTNRTVIYYDAEKEKTGEEQPFQDQIDLFGRNEVEENAVDVYVKQYRIPRGFYKENLEQIARLYGIGMEIYNGHEMIDLIRRSSKIPASLPFQLLSEDAIKLLEKEHLFTGKILYVLFDARYVSGDTLPDDLPYVFGVGGKGEKIKRIFNKMKRPDVKIKYYVWSEYARDNIKNEIMRELEEQLKNTGESGESADV